MAVVWGVLYPGVQHLPSGGPGQGCLRQAGQEQGCRHIPGDSRDTLLKKSTKFPPYSMKCRGKRNIFNLW